MSESKRVMAANLSRVQKNLMSKSFEDTNLQTLLPIIFEECLKENLTFWFNFLEDSCVLNLRDIRFDNYELNIRQYIGNLEKVDLDSIKEVILCNAFLITSKPVPIDNVASSKQKEENTNEIQEEKPIQESNLVPPSPIRIAIAGCEQDNEPVTRKNLEKRLNLKGMSQDKRRQCIAYLKSMKE